MSQENQKSRENQEERQQFGTVNIIRKGVNRVVKLSDGYHVDDAYERMEPLEKMNFLIRGGALDLHTHTNASDGFDSPPQLVEKVLALKLRAFAITDHDTLWGVQDAKIILDKLQQMRVQLPYFVPGAELSLDFEGQEIHLLAYFPGGGEYQINGLLEESKRRRDERNQKLCEKLTQLGMPMNLDELNRQGGQVINRVHAAMLMVRNGYSNSINEAFERWLGEGRPAFIRYEHPPLAQAIQVVNRGGGIAVAAHPATYHWIAEDKRLLTEKLEKLKALGVSGIETVHGEMSLHDSALVAEVARKLDLLRTIGSDYHGFNRKGVKLFRPDQDFSEYLL